MFFSELSHTSEMYCDNSWKIKTYRCNDGRIGWLYLHQFNICKSEGRKRLEENEKGKKKKTFKKIITYQTNNS